MKPTLARNTAQALPRFESPAPDAQSHSSFPAVQKPAAAAYITM